MQCKDIPDLPILVWLNENTNRYKWATIFKGFDNSIHQCMPNNIPTKLVRAKMNKLIRRGLVEGCVCGCRGDFYLTDKGKELINCDDIRKL